MTATPGMSTMPFSLYGGDVIELAVRLIGARLLVDGVGGMIVETEAYRRDDPASHTFRGPNRTNASMFGPAGHAYVYRSHGLHWCVNVVGDACGAVLIRALEPEFGIDIMSARRGGAANLCGGPGRLTQALGITGSHDGLRLNEPPLQLLCHQSGNVGVVVGPRIGITKAVDQPWRFGLQGSAHWSRPFR